MFNNKRFIHIIFSVVTTILITAIAFLSTLSSISYASSNTISRCQCTDYVYGQRPEIVRGMGNAKEWINSAIKRQYSYSQIPEVGDVAVFINGAHGFSGTYGHVAIVTWVNDTHTRYNIAGMDGIKSDCIVQTYSNLAITENDWFIHKDNNTSTQQTNQPTIQSSKGSIEFSPTSPAQVNQVVNISIKINPGSNYRAARLFIDYKVVREGSTTEFNYSWNTSGLSPSVHSIRLEVASTDDTNWIHPETFETTYLLRDQVKKENNSPNIPSPKTPSNNSIVDISSQLCWHNNGDPDGGSVMTRAEAWGNGSWISPWMEGDNPCWILPSYLKGNNSWAVRARDGSGAESGASSPWIISIKTSDTRKFTLPDLTEEIKILGCFDIGEISYSPTKEYFLVVLQCFEGDNSAFLFNANGSGKRRVTEKWDYINYYNYEWAPDGQAFYYERINSCCAEVPVDAPPRGKIKYVVLTGEKIFISKNW